MLVLTINLKGQLEGAIKSTEIQEISKKVKGKVKKITIKHSDRQETACKRVTHISDEIVSFWESINSPYWCNKKTWEKMSKHQRLIAHLDRMDEGFGYEFELV